MTAWLMIILAAGTMLILALFMACVLGWANKTFHVEVDPRVTAVNEALPGANCGGCGYVGCNEYAEAVVAGQVDVNKCTVGGSSCAAAVADILGVEVEQTWPFRPTVHCGATYADRLGRHPYDGERTCAAANFVAGVQGCAYGCLGFGDCVTACSFDAVSIVDGLSRVDYEKCVGCGACSRVCPRSIISMVPFKTEQMVVVACSNQDFGKAVKGVCKAGCIGCKACQRLDGLFDVKENLPRIDYEKYDPAEIQSRTAAMAKCPMKRLAEVGQPSEKDLAAVADEESPDVVTSEFETTVDKTEWHG